MRNVPLRACATPVAIGAWIAAVAAGMFQVWNYEMTTGHIGGVAARWPVDSALPFESDRARLLLFAHPRCPCTRASIEELARLLTQCGDRPVAIVVFLQPDGVDVAWVRDALWRRSFEIPQVRAVIDPGGREQARFGVHTSGHVLLYDREGILVFSGGITAARGHEGANAGAAAIADWYRHGTADVSETPVFGCSLSTP